MTSYDKEKYLRNKENILSINRRWALRNKEKLIEYRKEYRKKNIERIKQINRAYRLKNYDKIKNQIKKHYLENKAYYNKISSDYHKRTYLNIKTEVLSYYGNGKLECVCCGEKIIKFLTIDHINNNGGKHRKSLKQSMIYRWLKKNNYPSGYQTLCFNCNSGRQINDKICPHKLIKSLIPIEVTWRSN